ncbi:ATP-dependent DNA helicase RecQ [Filimonas lacunae]|uniref:ATP-dependent DNA helicase RecQ n=1 Tax=Filimonas lacunae TaxID=477680 RepID=A0A173MR74_9BACT|nr:ATP-dependent DNA helicase RecQ [Filimonas lacunae]BAV10152.1 ATP-dependent DNA helicase RecQ [Filimonas lacunae]SIT18796.1 ATP-dependent DNA helicase RecQ [Filimonas lacunae]
MKQSIAVLHKYWGYPSFRGAQEMVIDKLLEGKDVFALLPTGGGKSLCFQVPAMMHRGVCLVVTPLIALMKDQVEGLEKRGIGAMAIHSGMNNIEVRRTLDEVARDVDIRFLYVSPERLNTPLFLQYIDALDISLLVVDEAHCISQWGYDFRPSYLRIGELRKQLSSSVPCIALTASATPMVQEDIIERLQLKKPAVFQQSFDRPELAYRVFKVDSKINKILEALEKVQGSSIVYCSTRRRTQDVSRLLQMQGIGADFYHAGLPQDDRSAKQKAWISGEVRVMVCTNAFGMGIDKPDVRTVIHYDVPDCLENYYQEAGRAGRDGKKAYAVLLYQHQDVEALQELPDMRYPAIEDIKKVYQALADYLNIPVGVGEGVYYDFDFNEFARNFHLEPRLAMNAIKMLEQEGHLSFKENVFIPAQVQFMAARDQLFQIETVYPQLDGVTKCLLRSYEGIYDNHVAIYEKQIARLCRLTVEEVKQQLMQLHRLDIIEYLPQKEKPQIQYILNRAPANFLHIDVKNYAQRKELYVQRMQTMLRYLHLEKECRSRYIATYFGEENGRDCGVCDNCMTRKAATGITTAEFKQIAQEVYRVIAQQQYPLKEVVAQLPDVAEGKVQEVIRFLLAEEKIAMHNDGYLYRV